MITITAVEAATISLSLARPVQIATRRISGRFYTLIRVRCSDGSYGIGICHSGTRFGGLATAAVRELFRPLLVGQDPHRTEGLWRSMYQDSLLNGRTGAVMRALSAIDIALWDRNARAASLPLWRYLGGHADGTIPVYASGGYYGRSGTAETMRAEIEGYVAAGYKAAKIKIGGASPAVDLARVAAARDVLGEDRLLMLDANNAWDSFPAALDALRPMLAYRPYFIEEPFGPEDLDNHRRLADTLGVPIATGEIIGGRWGHRALMNEGGITVLQPDAAVCGGITEFRRIAAAAATFGVSIAPHSFQDIHAHLVGSTPNALFLEYFTDESIVPIGRALTRRLEVRDGIAVLPNAPGLGFDFDEDLVRANCADDWA